MTASKRAKAPPRQRAQQGVCDIDSVLAAHRGWGPDEAKAGCRPNGSQFRGSRLVELPFFDEASLRRTEKEFFENEPYISDNAVLEK